MAPEPTTTQKGESPVDDSLASAVRAHSRQMDKQIGVFLKYQQSVDDYIEEAREHMYFVKTSLNNVDERLRTIESSLEAEHHSMSEQNQRAEDLPPAPRVTFADEDETSESTDVGEDEGATAATIGGAAALLLNAIDQESRSGRSPGHSLSHSDSDDSDDSEIMYGVDPATSSAVPSVRGRDLPPPASKRARPETSPDSENESAASDNERAKGITDVDDNDKKRQKAAKRYPGWDIDPMTVEERAAYNQRRRQKEQARDSVPNAKTPASDIQSILENNTFESRTRRRQPVNYTGASRRPRTS